MVHRGGHDQLMDILLIGWWWGNWESASSTFWFQLVWGLCACGQHTVSFFLLVGVPVSAKQLKGRGSEYYLYSPWRTKGLWLCFIAKVLLFCLALLFFPHVLTSLMKSVLWLKLLYRQKAGHEWGSILESLLGSRLGTRLSSFMRPPSTQIPAGGPRQGFA